MKTVRHLSLALSVFSLLSLFPAIAGTRPTKTESYFFVSYEIIAHEKVNPYDIFVIPEGTEAELLSRVPYDKGDFVRVKLPDGSIGFMPTSTFADATLTLSKDGVSIILGGSSLPEGTYQVRIKTPWTYDAGPNQHYFRAVQGGRMMLKGKSGKSYLLEEEQSYSRERISEKGNKYTESRKGIHEEFNYGDFQEELEALPRGDRKDPRFIPVFKPDKNDLNAFAGFSRSYLETLFGEPYAYVGPALSQLPGCTYAVYKDVGWKRRKGEDEGGILVIYDKNLCARFLAPRPVGYTRWGVDEAPLLFPKHPIAEPVSALGSALDKEAFVYVPMKKEWESPSEVYRKPGGMDGLRIALPIFFERTLGITNPFAIMGVLLLLELLVAGFVIVWIRYIFNYGSNDWAGARCIILMIPIAVLVIAYLWRYPFLFAAFGAILAFCLMTIPSFVLDKEIGYKRCPKCHEYCEPEILRTVEGMTHGKDCSPTSRFEQIEVFRSSGDYDTFNDVFFTKYETTMRVSQDMEYDVKCPECGHRWTQKKLEFRPTQPGPILIVEEHDVRTATPYKETTTRTLYDGFGNKIGETEEVEHGVDHDRDRYKYYHYDYDGFQPYFNDFVNGDKKAFDRYYRDRWDSIDWREVCRRH